jgi:hypothetical protein
VSRLIAAGKLLSWHARCSAKDGKSAEAWESIDAILAAAESVETEPPMVSQLVRLVVLEQGLETIESLLDSLGPPPEAMRSRLEQRLAPEQLREGMRRSCEMELAMVHDTIAQFLKGGQMLPGLDEHRTGLGALLIFPEYRRGGTRCLDRLVRIRGMLDQPPATALPQLDAMTLEFQRDPMSFAFLIPAFSRALRREGEVSARLLLAREALRIRFEKHDSLSTLPKDPLTGRPLLFSRTEKGFSLQVDLTDTERDDLWKLEKPLTWKCPR